MQSFIYYLRDTPARDWVMMMCEHCENAWLGYTVESTKIMKVAEAAIKESTTYAQMISAMDARRESMKSVDEFFIRVKENCKQKRGV